LKLARDPGALAAIAHKLRDHRDTYPLFDTGRFTRHLEGAYTQMWERAQRGMSPDHFVVPPLS
jgi:predicted O-linked N-acetylglucosamine transferase (SPINDLY family)